MGQRGWPVAREMCPQFECSRPGPLLRTKSPGLQAGGSLSHCSRVTWSMWLWMAGSHWCGPWGLRQTSDSGSNVAHVVGRSWPFPAESPAGRQKPRRAEQEIARCLPEGPTWVCWPGCCGRDPGFLHPARAVGRGQALGIPHFRLLALLCGDCLETISILCLCSCSVHVPFFIDTVIFMQGCKWGRGRGSKSIPGSLHIQHGAQCGV